MCDSLRCPVCNDKDGACECQIYNYRDCIKQLKAERAKTEDNFTVLYDEQQEKIIQLEEENEGYRKDLPKYGKKIEKLSDENHALKEFIKSMAAQFNVMVKKL